MDRRQFMKTAAASGAAAVSPVSAIAARQQSASDYFGVHEFIENNPDAVFIMRTNVDDKTNGDAVQAEALGFGRSVFVPKTEADGGIPISHTVGIKPNLTSRGTWQSKGYSVEGTMGVITDARFVEGVIESIKELGLSGEQIHVRETNTSDDEMVTGGYKAMSDRQGINLNVNSKTVFSIDPDELTWKHVEDGVWFKDIPYLYPFNAPDSFLLNIAKFKTHGMGVTLCSKNMQGMLCHNYQAFCSGYSLNSIGMDPAHRNPNAMDDIQNSFDYLKDSIPRWDKPGTDFKGGIGMETWVHRTLDNHLGSDVGLHIVEGVYGRDGGGFTYGPHVDDTIETTNTQGLAKDFMTNIVIFGKNQFNVDIIGHWLAGHEPGNFGLFHVAVDRGLNNYLNPLDIPLYEWKDGAATQAPLSDFERTPLMTYYMQRDYSGQTEDYWHMVDETFDYATVSVDQPAISEKPEAMALHQNMPNPFNPNTSIEFSIPSAGAVRLEVYNANGQLVDVLADSQLRAGSHMAVWNTDNHSSGTYFYRLRHNGYTETKKMTLLK